MKYKIKKVSLKQKCWKDRKKKKLNNNLATVGKKISRLPKSKVFFSIFTGEKCFFTISRNLISWLENSLISAEFNFAIGKKT